MEGFKNRTAIISGGLGDIGKAIAAGFAKKGVNIALCDLQPHENALVFLNELMLYKIKVSYHQVDVANAEAVRNWIINAESETGVADIIIANAAIATMATFNEITHEQWNRELRVNLDGAFHVSKFATAQLIRHNRPGHVIFIGSWAAHAVHTHITAYCVSKAALRMLCKCAALELAPHNILVNEIAPGYVDAGLSGRSFEKDAAVKEAARQRVPVKKLITAEEVAQQVELLCDSSNKHITGSTLLMDGGLSLLC